MLRQETKKCRVIIPSAIYIPEELQGIGKLPAVIYPINGETVFDFFYRQYAEKAETLEVVCFEGAEKIHRQLKAKKYNAEKIRFTDLIKLEDLGHTVYAALSRCCSPVIINFSDTIVMEEDNDILPDSFYYHEMDPTQRWTYFEDCDGVVTKIYDKTGDVASGVKKMFVGVFRIEHAETLKQCLEKAFMEEHKGISSFYYALMLYTRLHPLQPIYTDNWFDIGHADRYFSSQLEVKAREFNHIMVDRNRGMLRKTSDDKEKFIGEILWYLKLPLDVEYVRPRIFRYSLSYDDPYVEMEYYSYHTLSELYLYGDLAWNQWRDIFKRIRFILNDFSRYKVSDESNIRAAYHQVYHEKTLKRLELLRKQDVFVPFFTKSFFVNGREFISLDCIIEKLKDAIPELLYDGTSFCIVHGDLCFSNIMVDSDYSFIKVIDPRGKFGKYDIYGDQRYEIAKLFHSIEGKYDFIIKDLFIVETEETEVSIRYEINDRPRNYDLMDIFRTVFEDYIVGREREIRFIEALLFLSMLPLHKESIQHQLALFATGIELLDKVLDIRVNKTSEAEEG